MFNVIDTASRDQRYSDRWLQSWTSARNGARHNGIVRRLKRSAAQTESNLTRSTSKAFISIQQGGTFEPDAARNRLTLPGQPFSVLPPAWDRAQPDRHPGQFPHAAQQRRRRSQLRIEPEPRKHHTRLPSIPFRME